MIDNILISIVVPVYNGSCYLEDCVKSLLKQDYPYYEIILVDDGSTDETPILCDMYSKQHDSIRVIHQKNGGVTSARKTGVLSAKGKWVLFVDSDDFICNESYLSEIAGHSEDGELVICGSKNDELSSDQFVEGLLYNRISWRVVNKLYPKDIIREALCIDRYYNIGEDLLCNLIVSNHIKVVTQKGCEGYVVRDNGQSVTHTRRWSLEYECDFISEVQRLLCGDARFKGGVSIMMINAWKNLLINNVDVPWNNPWRKYILENKHGGRMSASELILLYVPSMSLQRLTLRLLQGIR